MQKIASLLIPLMLSSATDFAFADYDLLVKSNCLACHYIDKRKYGPKLNEIASKYGDVSNAADVLARKIRAGGTGVWGEDVMPPQPQLSEADAMILSKYILNLK